MQPGGGVPKEIAAEIAAWTERHRLVA